MRIAAVQAAPAFLDRERTIEIVIERIEEAAAAGAEVVAFPETFVPGYPVWVDLTNASTWQDPKQQAAFAWYLDQAVDVHGSEFATVVECVARADVFAWVGVVERAQSNGSVYCSLVAIDPVQGIVSVHRKLKPTYAERLVWADGDGAGLVAHRFGGTTMTGLNCWENWMPLARSAMYQQGSQVHIATWPGSAGLTSDITRFVAMEGRLFVVSVGAIYGAEHIPEDFPLRDELVAAGSRYFSGGTCIAGPDGRWIVEPLRHEERIVYADLDLTAVGRARQNFDPAGHYSRPDVLELHVRADRIR